MSEPAAIILAAGQSRRFGADKLLVPVEHRGRAMPLIARTLASWLQVFPRVVAVVRPGSETLEREVASALPEQAGCIDWVICPTAGRGMGASLATGVAAREGACGWLIGLADMPAVPHTVIAQIRQAIVDGATLVAPFCGGRRGHPVGFCASYREALLALDGDWGARSLIERNAHQLLRIDTEDSGVLTDIDTPSDLLSLNF